MTPLWIERLEYLSWALIAIALVFFVPWHLPFIFSVPMVIASVFAAKFGSILLWRSLAAIFGWKLPDDD